MKPIIQRRCPLCGWYQVRAETDTTFMYTPCTCTAALGVELLPKQLLKTDVEIVDEP